MARITQKICRLGCHALSAMVVATATLSSAWAARDFTPQAGTWVIREELDGKPGRGLAIDVQGNTFFMQVFGYEKNGDATFYTATGQMDGNTVTAPLMRYQGGRSFGGEAKDAVEDGSPGAVTVSFANGLQGMVQFPGEKVVAIERFEFARRDDPYYQSELWQTATRGSQWFVLDEQGRVESSWYATLKWGGTDAMRLVLSRSGAAYTQVVLQCTKPVGTESLNCQLPGGAPELGVAANIRSAVFRMAGAHIAGRITMNTPDALPQRLLGFSTVTTIPFEGAVITGCCVNGLETFVKGMGFYRKPTPMPSTGTWVVEEELTGKPGRGLSLDVQGGTMVMQVFNYLEDGSPSFHMGSGAYASSEAGQTSSFTLYRYSGGRSLGGSAATAHEQDNAGEVQVTFPVYARDAMARGTIQFPGEAVKSIIRMPLESRKTLEDRLLGEWFFATRARNESGPITVTLDRLSGNDGAISNAAGDVRCLVDSNLGMDVCQLYTTVSPQSPASMAVDTSGGFIQSWQFFKIRDRYGNLMGLGNVPLD